MVQLRQKLDRAAEANIVADDGGRSDGQWLGTGDVELVELDPALPHLAQKILEHLDGELLAGTTAIAEAERRKACIVTDRQRIAIDNAVYRAEAAIVDGRLAPVGHIERLAAEGAFGEADFFALPFVDVVAGRGTLVAIRVEFLRVLPVDRVHARRGVRAHHIAVPLVRWHPHFFHCRDASPVRGDGAEQLHHEALERRESLIAGVVGIPFHGLLEPSARVGVAGVVGGA